jgi:hypothetical protein
MLTLTACAKVAAASVDRDDEIVTPETESPLVNQSENTTQSGIPEDSAVVLETDAPAHSEGWREETHGNDTEPNYAVVFPEDEVKQITILISPENWAAMQANMTELFGEAGSGDERKGFPGNEQPLMEGRPPVGDRSQPGDAGFPESIEPPQWADRSAPPADAPIGERPVGGRFGGGDMTPENPMWVPATIEFEGNTWTNVGVRYKGNSSLTSGWRSGTLKLPLKLDFDEFEDIYPEIEDQRFYGFKQLSLANGFSDASILRDAATSLILAEAGLPAAKTAYYEVILDYGEGPVTLGLYTMIEVVDDTVIERVFGSDEGNTYEAEGPAASFAAATYGQIEQSFQKENNKDEADWRDIEALFEVLHSDQRSSEPAAWRAELESIFDVDSFLEWLAISAVIQHWDAYGNMSHNYYLYYDPDTGQLTWISWDHNMVMSEGMGRRDANVSLDKAEISEDWPLIRHLLDDPVYYERYVAYLAATVEGPFNPDRMTEKYQDLAELIAPYAAADVGKENFDKAVEQLIEFTYQRANAVEEFLSSIDY